MQEHRVIICCGSFIFMRLFDLVEEGELVLYSSCFKCLPAQFINQFCSACFAAVVI